MKRAYAKLKNLTPIPADCGKLCDKRCCKGNEGDGMILFPGEDENRLPPSFTLSDSDIYGYPVRFAACIGLCKRGERPLACRIFPFAPYLKDGAELTIIADPRAKFSCPLLDESALPLIDQRFLNCLEEVFTDLLTIEGMRPMLEAYTRMMDYFFKFTGAVDMPAKRP